MGCKKSPISVQLNNHPHVRAWVCNYIQSHCFVYMINNPCPKLDAGLSNLSKYNRPQAIIDAFCFNSSQIISTQWQWVCSKMFGLASVFPSSCQMCWNISKIYGLIYNYRSFFCTLVPLWTYKIVNERWFWLCKDRKQLLYPTVAFFKICS